MFFDILLKKSLIFMYFHLKFYTVNQSEITLEMTFKVNIKKIENLTILGYLIWYKKLLHC